MKIAICGPNRESVISNVEKSLNIQVKKPWDTGSDPTIIDYAAETYKYDNENVVVYDGSAFDFLVKHEGEGYDDVYEQIALDSLNNLDYIAVITMDMDKSMLNMYNEYAKIFPEKFFFYKGTADFEIVMR